MQERDVKVIIYILEIRPHSPIADPSGGGLRHKGNVDDQPVPSEEKGPFPPGVDDSQL